MKRQSRTLGAEMRRSMRQLEREQAKALSQPRRFRAEARPGEILAMRPEAFFSLFDFWGPAPVERTEDGIAIIRINGPLEHHASWCWDSYERIASDVEKCMSGQDVVEANRQEHWSWWDNDWREGHGEVDPAPARAVILRIDSPGGEAAGATWIHRKLRSLRKRYGVPLYAYADEMAASAAYSIASGADELWLPDTGTVGSIGVIATLFSRTRMNDKMGLNVELVTSGDYKADGHADRPINDGVRDRMLGRVMKLARIFWAVVAKSRETSPEAIAALEAGVFVGADAVEVGIADGVKSWGGFLKMVSRSLEPVDNVTTPSKTAASAA